jgi:LCP family protein required for cell wall assembly
MISGGLLIFYKFIGFYKTHIKRIVLAALIFAGIYLFFAAAAVVLALTVDARRGSDLRLPDPPPTVGNGNNNERDLPSHFLTPPLFSGDDEPSTLRPAARTNFIILGIDNFSLADVIMVGTFYRDSGDIRFMSVPRDLYITLSDIRHAQIRELGLNIPQQLKVNELRSYGGSAWGTQLIMQELSDMLGVQFHYHLEVRLPAFRRIVDAIDGVYFNVPYHLFYEDPFQDLIIDVPAGFRRLDGALAEGLIRYRGYDNADLGRINVQMQFMTAVLTQLMTREAIMNNPLELARIIIEDVNTNMTVMGLLRYLPYITSASTDRIKTFTMPGTDGYRRGAGSVFLPCPDRLFDVTWEVFYANIEPTTAEPNNDA